MFVLILCSACSTVSYVVLRNRFISYQMSLLAVFIVGLTMSGQLDSTLPVLVLFSLLPYLTGVGRFNWVSLLFILSSMAYLIFGVVCQSATASFVMFLSRLMQFVAFYLIFDNEIVKKSPEPTISLVVAMTIVESVIGLYLIKNGTMAANIEMEGVRLVSNSQPITGNIAVCLLPLIGYIYFFKKPSGKQIALVLFCMFILAFWVVLSGTRGYTLVFGAGFLFILADFFFSGNKTRIRMQSSVLALCFVALVCLLLVGIFQEQIFNKIDNSLRLSGSLGIRDQENKTGLLFYHSEHLASKLFGIGIGASWGEHPEYVSAVQSVFGTTGVAARYLSRVGTNFHNFYLNILCLQGLFGICILATVFFDLIGKALSLSCNSSKAAAFYVLYIVMFALMLYFRWSADCGIIELVSLAYIFNLINLKGKLDCC